MVWGAHLAQWRPPRGSGRLLNPDAVKSIQKPNAVLLADIRQRLVYRLEGGLWYEAQQTFESLSRLLDCASQRAVDDDMALAGDDAGALADGVPRAEAGLAITPGRKVGIRPHVIVDAVENLARTETLRRVDLRQRRLTAAQNTQRAAEIGMGNAEARVERECLFIFPNGLLGRSALGVHVAQGKMTPRRVDIQKHGILRGIMCQRHRGLSRFPAVHDLQCHYVGE